MNIVMQVSKRKQRTWIHIYKLTDNDWDLGEKLGSLWLPRRVSLHIEMNQQLSNFSE